MALEQGGLLTRAQCLGAGMSPDAVRWRLARRRRTSIHRGVYLSTPGRDDWWSRALAAQLAVDDAACSQTTAAFVHGLLAVMPRTIDLLVSHDRRASATEGTRLHRRRGDVNRFVDELHWPWRTTVEETLLDVCTSASVDEIFAVLGRAFQRRLTTETALLGCLALRARHPRRELLEMVLGDVAEGAESAMEVRFLGDVERASLAAETGAVLNSRGWEDRIHPCRRHDCVVRQGALRGGAAG